MKTLYFYFLYIFFLHSAVFAMENRNAVIYKDRDLRLNRFRKTNVDSENKLINTLVSRDNKIVIAMGKDGKGSWGISVISSGQKRTKNYHVIKSKDEDFGFVFDIKLPDFYLIKSIAGDLPEENTAKSILLSGSRGLDSINLRCRYDKDVISESFLRNVFLKDSYGNIIKYSNNDIVFSHLWSCLNDKILKIIDTVDESEVKDFIIFIANLGPRVMPILLNKDCEKILLNLLEETLKERHYSFDKEVSKLSLSISAYDLLVFLDSPEWIEKGLRCIKNLSSFLLEGAESKIQLRASYYKNINNRAIRDIIFSMLSHHQVFYNNIFEDQSNSTLEFVNKFDDSMKII